ncbi:hypothetical protein AWB80_03361 [Caballeronia pedi]|uniref:Uncharacterized protein n=1 Tax=Caballeronia pedi TaxID=1777141 RepID=A0A158BDA2_9BURK|nr:hypothetical protein AWB80_03361 [Caballeronia pedi]
MACVLIGVSASLFPVASTSLTRFENETTVYMLSCDGERINDVCSGNERTGVPFTYKVSVDQNSVLYWTMNDPNLARRLPFCAIQNSRSWLCQWTNDDIPKTRFGMVGGRYVEIAVCSTGAPVPMFYQVYKWRWWLVRLREAFGSSLASTRHPLSTMRTAH